MLQLRKLEAVYAEELRALESGAIEWRNGKRIDWRVKGGGKFDRPSDLQALGEVGTAGQAPRMDAYGEPVLGVGTPAIGGRVDSGGYSANLSGRSPSVERRSGVAVEGVS